MISDLTQVEDLALMRSYQMGDSSAFEELYRRYSGRVFAYLKRRCPDRTVVDELLQQAFMKFHRTRSNYDPKYPVLQWLFVISRSVWIDHCRAQKNERHEPLNEAHAQIPANLSSEEERRSIDELLSQIPNLSDTQRRIMELRLVDDLSYREISQRLERSEASIRQVFSRISRQLRRVLVPASRGSE